MISTHCSGESEWPDGEQQCIDGPREQVEGGDESRKE